MNLSDAEARMLREALSNGRGLCDIEGYPKTRAIFDEALAMLDAKAGECQGGSHETCKGPCHGNPSQGEEDK